MENIEILSPVGSFDNLIAAVENGANAVYFGAKNFNARNFADNFDDKTLKKAIEYAKVRGVKTYLTLNTLIKNSELIEALDLVNTAYSYGIDALIIQDIGFATLIKKLFPNLDLHASTQMAVHNLEGVKFLESLGFKRVVLARELSIDEISYITKNTNVEIECFVHGAICISFSGQCLLSSLIGQRSANRGKCAQACRLPYTLLKDNIEIKNGYLLSPKDLCSIEYVDMLKKANIHSFKIEGRMKSKEYVAITTRLYSKALKGEEITEDDIFTLKQIFNRGDFTTNNLLEKQDIIYDIKPKNLGTYLGKIIDFDKQSGLISIKLDQDLSMGDGIETLNMECSTLVTQMIYNGQNIREAKKGQTIQIGKLKNVKKDLMIYKTSSKTLNKSIEEDLHRETRKTSLDIDIDILNNKQIYVNINNEFKYTFDEIPQNSINKPLTKDTVIAQFSKTNETPFEFKNFNINLDDNLFLPLSKLNQLRSEVLEKYYYFKLSKIRRNKIDRKKYIDLVNNTIKNQLNNKEKQNKQYYIYLNKINENTLSINKVDGIYVPYKFFIDNNTKDIINKLCEKQNVYLALPNILKDDIFSKIKLDFKNIKGIMISNISQINLVKNINLPIHTDYTLNIFNTFSYNFFKKYNIDKICVSPELNENEINNISDDLETVCYGQIKCMTINNCIIKDCKNCPNYNYSLKDRLNYIFPIITDNFNCTMNIYNSKILSYNSNKLYSNIVRLDFIDDDIKNINQTISMFKTGNNYSGDNYTNGHFKKEV